jgi:hypothetical protein
MAGSHMFNRKLLCLSELPAAKVTDSQVRDTFRKGHI